MRRETDIVGRKKNTVKKNTHTHTPYSLWPNVNLTELFTTPNPVVDVGP